MDQFQVQVKKSSKKIAKIVHPCLTISNDACRMLQYVLGHLNKEVIAACKKGPKKGAKKSTNTEVMEVQVAQRAVNSIFPKELRKYATAEGHKSLAKFSAGLLAYKPQLSKQKKKEKRTAPQEFMKSVPTLMSMVAPNSKIQKDAREMVADVMGQMCKTVIDKASANGDANNAETLGPQDVIKAVNQVMGPVMAKHAIAEGARNAMLYMNGLSEYKPENFSKDFKKTNPANKDKIDNLMRDIRGA